VAGLCEAVHRERSRLRRFARGVGERGVHCCSRCAHGTTALRGQLGRHRAGGAHAATCTATLPLATDVHPCCIDRVCVRACVRVCGCHFGLIVAQGQAWLPLQALHGEVAREDMPHAVNGMVVGLLARGGSSEQVQQSDWEDAPSLFGPPMAVRPCLGLGIVRAVDLRRRLVHLLTPLPEERLAEVTVLQVLPPLLKGPLPPLVPNESNAVGPKPTCLPLPQCLLFTRRWFCGSQAGAFTGIKDPMHGCQVGTICPILHGK
jgi:hypothetical protein